MVDIKNMRDLVHGRWPEILSRLGVGSEFLSKRNTPCPFCGGKDRFTFDNKNGNGSFICRQCGAGDGFAYAMKFTGLPFADLIRHDVFKSLQPSTFKNVERMPTQDEDGKAHRKIWLSAMPATEDCPVGLYLKNRLGVAWGLDTFRYAPHVYHPATKQMHPAMLARVVGVDNKIANIHVTYLTSDGKKLNSDPSKKVMQGSLPDGCAIRLGPSSDTMGIAEGIETALACQIMFDMPCWAAVNGLLLSRWIPPARVKKIIVYGDSDRSYTGQARAYELARRLAVQLKLDVEVFLPEKLGNDWNDVLVKSLIK